MTDHMTKTPGSRSTDDVVPGMAYFPDTGPFGSTCGTCKHRGYTREGARGYFDPASQQVVHKHHWVGACHMFKKLTGRYGPAVKKDYPACKYFEEKEKK